MRALTAVSVSVLAGCLAAPPSATQPPGDDPDAGPSDTDCTSYGFDGIDGLYANTDDGCRLAYPDRLHIVQDGDVALNEGCYVEPVTYFSIASLQIHYGAESDMPAALVMYRSSDGENVQVNRTGDTLYLLVLDAAANVIVGQSATFDPSWTRWRIDVAPDMVAISAGPTAAELDELMTLPYTAEEQMGIVVGAWPGALPGGEREVSFDDLVVCPPSS